MTWLGPGIFNSLPTTSSRSYRVAYEILMNAIQTVVVDDNVRYRASLAAYLAQWPEIRVVAEANDGVQALDLVAQLQPDLLLVDVVMPGMSGIELTRKVKAMASSIRVLVLTFNALAAYRTAALEAGADDFLGKDQVTTALVPAIQRLFPTSPNNADVRA